MTNDTPERIWAFAPDIFDEMSVWQDHPSLNGDAVEYIRADLADALVAEAYEVAAVIASDNAPATVKASAIRTLTPADAMAARDARDKQVRAEALREAADIKLDVEVRTDDWRHAALDTEEAYRKAILALIPADQEGTGDASRT